MAERTFTLPFRGKITSVRADGHIIAPSGVEPIDLMQLAMESPNVRKQPEIEGYMSNYDYETGTVDCKIVCDDAGFLDDLGAFIKNTPDLRAAEIAMMRKNETSLSTTERNESESQRTEFAKGVQISRANLAKWKKARAKT